MQSIDYQYIFETSWEVCNKINGVHTVLSDKAELLSAKFNNNYILIGPDVWREEKENPEFTEDKTLFREWRKYAKNNDKLRFTVGRWNIKGSPVTILLDFSNFVSQKNEIFKSFWEKYKLDSISGDWEYIKHAAFGYGAGKLIESYCNFYLSADSLAVAHFHDWKTGAGLLYLNYNLPNIATLFTVHSPVIAETVANSGNNNLYSDLQNRNPYETAKNFNIISKFSLEKISAITANVFSTPSLFTADLCKTFINKKPEVILPNGFDFSNIPTGEDYIKKRAKSRKKIKEVSEAVLNKKITADTKFIYTSGYYDFNNKGIELLISAAKTLNKKGELNKEVIIFLLIPSNIYEVKKDLYEKIYNKSDISVQDKILTHNLHEFDFDDILNTIKQKGIQNQADDNVKVIFVPAFLDGNDGIFNLKYLDLIIGFDYGVFPSYYEPWGYTLLESLALHNPVTATNLSGFGSWLQEQSLGLNECINIIERTDTNKEEVIESICEQIISCSHSSKDNIKSIREKAHKISLSADKNKLIENYYKAYNLALEKVEGVKTTFTETPKYTFKEVKTYKSNKPIWRTLSVKPKFSGKLNRLDELSKNLWWVWNPEAGELFNYISGSIADASCSDPISMLKKIPYKKFSKLENDPVFIEKFDKVYNDFQKYMSQPYAAELPTVAYFSMEYGLTDILKIYSGGLGVLAGDYFKQASDSGYNMSAVGLFYRQGYFKQQISVRGEQHAVYESQKFNDLPAELVKDKNDNPVTVQIAFPGRNINIQIWKINVGRVNLYLLDTDRDDNRKEDRLITYRLYGGDNENRLKQEIILGIGGIRALNALNINQEIYHCNEGHAALIGLERIHKLMVNSKLSFSEALEIVRASALFTTHTPVPAGHDAFNEDLIGVYMGHYPERFKISWEKFINLGKFRPGKEGEEFSMSVFAANTSQEINGVSKLHGEVSRNVIFNKLWDGYFPEELHIGYVTNGVHYPTWTAKEWQNILKGENNEPDFSKINKISDSEIWQIRLKHKQQLIDFINTRLDTVRIKRQENPKLLLKIKSTIKADVLTIGFARRFAPYKRGDLIFNDLKRLEKIVNNTEMSVHFIFAGKAHPRDGEGQDLIKRVVEMTKRPEFEGKILFLEDYNILMAKHLVKGVDIWLNTPTRPLEASGTSGMKAVMNGVLNFSVLDGWWIEGYKEGAGWELPEKKTYDSQEMQDDLDVEMIYRKLENEIIPLYYKRNKNNIPVDWIKYIRKCIAEIAPEFTTKRMINDYNERFYGKLKKRHSIIEANNFKFAIEISAWKKKIENEWDKIEVLKLNISDPVKNALTPGEKYYGELILDIKNIEVNNIGAEMLITEDSSEGERKIISISPLKLTRYENNKVYYSIEISPYRAGSFDYAFRIFPKNENLPHRQDFSYVKWA